MDLRFFWLINQLSGRNRTLDKSMILISNRARYIYFAILAVLFFKNPTSKRAAIEAGKSISLALFFHILIKALSFRPRPFVKRRVGILIPSKTDSTFPSKHTLLAFSTSVSIFFHYRILGAWMLFLSALTGFSRIWVGHHYPSDILGSSLAGLLSSLAIRIFSRNKQSQIFD
ncbi:phosphatase PAP2 family protein [Bacillus sp. REN3]|uniref:phosphatase PAP2 family protein n=1 Tax=Bacillus sp. REN3 TaxID=2802440 RepID=UPI001AEE45A5|nr:phosphatase PAP2 family protein [Bacillus sp. REN3]